MDVKYWSSVARSSLAELLLQVRAWPSDLVEMLALRRS
jgi:hypothetical protein